MTAVPVKRRLVVGWPPYLRILTAGLRELGLDYEVEPTSPHTRTLVYVATDQEEARFRALVLPVIRSIRSGGTP